MKKSNQLQLKTIAWAVSIACAAISTSAYAVGEASVHGTITGAAAGTEVIIVNVDTGTRTKVKVGDNGSYNALGLQPGNYAIKVKGGKSEPITLQVGESANLDLEVAAAPAAGTAPAAGGAPSTGSTASSGGGNLGTVVIKGGGSRKGVKNSQVGANVSTRQIEALPQNSRNFLASVDVAPGVRYEESNDGTTKFRGSDGGMNGVNVFIDGVSQKENVLKGGVSGQDSSRGNPFPQSAIAEYKVISSNYKAEFDQVSSAAIVAVTKSGTNEFHGDAFVDFTDKALRAASPQEIENFKYGTERPYFAQKQYGVSLGGPIVKDVAHFFVAYEGKDIANPRTLNTENYSKLPASQLNYALGKANLNIDNTAFKENLLHTKLDAQITDNQKLELTAKYRKESDRKAEDAGYSDNTNYKTTDVDEKRFALKHAYQGAGWLNEAMVSYENSHWIPRSETTDDQHIYYVAKNYNENGTVKDKDKIIQVGGSPDNQKKGQKAWGFQDDFTYSAIDKHVIKTGLKVKKLKYDMLEGGGQYVNVFENVYDPNTQQWVETQTKTKSAATKFLNYKNTQLGAYVQDDWTVNDKLELNLGVRWDYETNMLNNKLRTNPAIITALNTPLSATVTSGDDGHPGVAGQTYTQSLANGGIDIADYIHTKDRKGYKKAIAPRLGFSYDIKGDKDTVIFGGYGRSYDRAIADQALYEATRNGTSGEVAMINNNFKMPYSDQFSLGLRKAVGAWNAEIGASRLNGRNGLVWFTGKRYPDGASTDNGFDPIWTNNPEDGTKATLPGYEHLILGDFLLKSKTNMAYLKAEKPFTKESGWGVTLGYTFTDSKSNHRELKLDESFSWMQKSLDVASAGKMKSSRDVEKHRFVATGIWALPYDLTLSGKLTLGSGANQYIIDGRNGQILEFKPRNGIVNRQLDVGLAKEWKLWGDQKFELRGDVINLFNNYNYNEYSTNWIWSDSDYANRRAHAKWTAKPTRTFKFTARYKW